MEYISTDDETSMVIKKRSSLKVKPSGFATVINLELFVERGVLEYYIPEGRDMIFRRHQSLIWI